MGNPYQSQAISGYNPSPPADDGSQVVSNRMTWAGVKTKLNDPIKAFAEAINTATGAGFGKVIGGVGVTSTAISYAVVAAHQGKLVRRLCSPEQFQWNHHVRWKRIADHRRTCER